MKAFALSALFLAGSLTPALAHDEPTADVHRPSPSAKQYLATAMRDAQHNEQDHFMERTFSSIDANGDGMIAGTEFNSFHDIKFNEIDGNHDGVVSKAEVIAYYDAMHGDMHAPDASKERLLERKFVEIDQNNDNMLSRAESKIFHQQLFSNTDTNHNNLVSHEEAASMYREKRDMRSKPMQEK